MQTFTARPSQNYRWTDQKAFAANFATSYRLECTKPNGHATWADSAAPSCCSYWLSIHSPHLQVTFLGLSPNNTGHEAGR
ncbi:hypothetical protein HBH70_211230 [Parastagonospora nodorum]|nr:hypothetical protein HBH52_163780 [Parastagonospora nodorum]KAH4190827.1 hypothetical protein HBI95_216500 [Parastagonospora nodorum]KAH4221217.1 hypothetical protein HBI06_161510 [Parastagonospora nodorum]KAH4247834.1 hypothetical protein HBI05_032570 [Parastagonospora nodorum]KAH4285489.1 hypothetical protein HBI02_229940 [Parastagonospora nodorum]